MVTAERLDRTQVETQSSLSIFDAENLKSTSDLDLIDLFTRAPNVSSGAENQQIRSST